MELFFVIQSLLEQGNLLRLDRQLTSKKVDKWNRTLKAVRELQNIRYRVTQFFGPRRSKKRINE